MRVAAPPVDGSVQMLPCMSIASVRPSGDTATDIDVPSRTVTSIGGRAGAASRAARPIVASNAAVRTMIPPGAHSTGDSMPPLTAKPFDFTGATAVVVGGATGLGFAMAEGLAAHGAEICIVSRSEDRARAAAASIGERHSSPVSALSADVSDEMSVRKLAIILDRWFDGGLN